MRNTFPSVLKIGLFLICSTVGFFGYAQQFRVYQDGQLFLEKRGMDSTSAQSLVDRIIFENLINGFPFSQLDSIVDNTYWVHKGQPTVIEIDSIIYIDEDVATIASINHPYRWIQNKLAVLSDEGYPFARISFQGFHEEGHHLWASIKVDQGPRITWDSIKFISSINTSPGFIYKSLNITPGTYFSESAYKKIGDRISRTPFLILKMDPDISFENKTATAYLDIKELSSSSFEGVLGLLSNQTQNGGTFLSGFINLHLGNLFYSGKTLDFKWNRYGVQSQSLDLAVSYPYPIGSRVLADFGFSLLKQDTTFLNQSFNLALSTYLGSSLKFSGGYERINGSLIEPNLINLNRNLADFSTGYYSLGLDFNQAKVPFLFESGVKSYAQFSVGQKRIDRNPSLPESFYDSLTIRSTSYKCLFHVSGQRILTKRGVLFNRLEAGGIWNQGVFNSELFRLGGLRSIRGFNENYFFTKQYLLNQLEWRQYFESKSYFMVFYDQMVAKDRGGEDFPFGIGAGFYLSTSNGLLNFVVANGQDQYTSLNFATLKIHIGYQATF